MVKNARFALPRFFDPDLDATSASATLPADESRHLTRVLRLGAGDRVAVFDGRGHEFAARVERAHPTATVLALLDAVDPAPESRVPFTLAQAVLKGSSMDDVIRDATMMGAAEVAPILTEHVAVAGSVRARKSLVGRWRRIAVAAAKQSRRATVPVVRDPETMRDWLAEAPQELKLIFVEPSAGTDPVPAKSIAQGPPPRDAVLLIGPEGGWASEEIASAIRAGSIPVSLGPLTLRADAAPIAAIAVFRFLWEV